MHKNINNMLYSQIFFTNETICAYLVFVHIINYFQGGYTMTTQKTNITDMTVGNPTGHILKFALPVLVGNMFQQLYNTIDSLVVGKYVSADALAATGSCGSLNFLFFSLSSGLAIGIGIIISQYYGAKDDNGVRKTIANSLYILCMASLLATLIGVSLARPLLRLMATPNEILDMATLYLRTTCCGILFIALYNGVASALRALGDSKTPLYFLIISSFLNIGFDLLFVLKFKMGVFGVGFATVIAQFVSAIISLGYAIIYVPYFRLSKNEMKPETEIIVRSFKLGVPMALQSSMIAISMIVIQSVVNGFGTIVMAAYTITCKVDLIASQLYNAMSTSLVTYSGQNFGANDIDRIKKGYIRGLAIVTIYNCIVVPIVYTFSHPITAFFVNDASVISFGSDAMRITAIFYFALGIIYIPRGILNGCGDAKFSLINGITEVACRIVYATALTRIASIGMWGIWWATGLTWVTVAIVCNSRYLTSKWKTLYNVKAQEQK